MGDLGPKVNSVSNSGMVFNQKKHSFAPYYQSSLLSVWQTYFGGPDLLTKAATYDGIERWSAIHVPNSPVSNHEPEGAVIPMAVFPCDARDACVRPTLRNDEAYLV